MGLNPGQIASIAEGGIGITTAIGGAIYGGVKSRKWNKKYDRLLGKMQNKNEDWNNIRQSKDDTLRVDNQAVNKKQREMLLEQAQRNRATNIVAGGTDESLALQNEGMNRSIAQTQTDMAARAAADKDEAERQYLSQDYALNQQQLQNYQQKAAATAQAASQVVNAGLQMTGNSFQHFAQSSGMGGGGGADMSTFAKNYSG